MSETVVLDASAILCLIRGLSFGDRACLALAKRIDAIALTTDRAWGSIGDAARIAFAR